MRKLTDKQKRILEFLRSFINENGYAPTVREIQLGLGTGSTSGIHLQLDNLAKAGYIKREKGKRRTIELLEKENYVQREDRFVSVPLVGRVAAGQPIMAVENIEDYYPIPSDLFHGEDLFMLKVQGESMIDAGILSGDYIVVKKQDYADDGDIVVALIEDSATVKYFRKGKRKIKLVPANRKMKPIDVTKDTLILGKVVGQMRAF